MSPNAQRILTYIKHSVARNGWSPSMREIASDLGLAVATVHYHVHKLIAAGHLKHAGRYSNRTLRVP